MYINFINFSQFIPVLIASSPQHWHPSGLLKIHSQGFSLSFTTTVCIFPNMKMILFILKSHSSPTVSTRLFCVAAVVAGTRGRGLTEGPPELIRTVDSPPPPVLPQTPSQALILPATPFSVVVVVRLLAHNIAPTHSSSLLTWLIPHITHGWRCSPWSCYHAWLFCVSFYSVFGLGITSVHLPFPFQILCFSLYLHLLSVTMLINHICVFTSNQTESSTCLSSVTTHQQTHQKVFSVQLTVIWWQYHTPTQTSKPTSRWTNATRLQRPEQWPLQQTSPVWKKAAASWPK